MAGAAIGVLSARAAYWLLPLERKLLGWNESGRTAMALPAYSPDTKSVGVVFTMTYSSGQTQRFFISSGR